MAITLYDNETGAELGAISEQDLNFLIDHLEEETSDDRDYYLRAETLDLLDKAGASPALSGMLRKALGDREGIEVRWQRTG